MFDFSKDFVSFSVFDHVVAARNINVNNSEILIKGRLRAVRCKSKRGSKTRMNMNRVNVEILSKAFTHVAIDSATMRGIRVRIFEDFPVWLEEFVIDRREFVGSKGLLDEDNV